MTILSILFFFMFGCSGPTIKSTSDGLEYLEKPKYRFASETIRPGIINYKGTPFSGTFIDYYKNGQLKSEGKYNEGKAEGLWKFYHNNSQLKSEKGTGKVYFDDLNLSYEGEFNNGKKVGLWKGDHENGQLKSEGNYKENEKEGLWTEYWKNGQIDRKKNYKDGRLDGPDISYTRGGKLAWEYNYKNGEMMGLQKWYWSESGKIQRIYDKKIDEPYLYKEYYQNGQLREQRSMLEDTKNNCPIYVTGTRKLYFENGQLKEEESYNRQTRELKMTGYWEDGELRYINFYKMDKSVCCEMLLCGVGEEIYSKSKYISNR